MALVGHGMLRHLGFNYLQGQLSVCCLRHYGGSRLAHIQACQLCEREKKRKIDGGLGANVFLTKEVSLSETPRNCFFFLTETWVFNQISARNPSKSK